MIEADLARPKPPPTLSPTTRIHRMDSEGSGLLDLASHKHYGNSSTLSPDNVPSEYVQPANFDAYEFMKDLPNGKILDHS